MRVSECVCARGCDRDSYPGLVSNSVVLTWEIQMCKNLEGDNEGKG